MAVERVAGSSWNQWPDVHGMGGRMAVESANNGQLLKHTGHWKDMALQKIGVGRTGLS